MYNVSRLQTPIRMDLNFFDQLMNKIFGVIKLPIITFRPQHPHTQQPHKLHKGAP